MNLGGGFNLKTSRDNVMYTLFNTNISEFSGNLEGIIDEGMYKRTIKNVTDFLEGQLIQVC